MKRREEEEIGLGIAPLAEEGQHAWDDWNAKRAALHTSLQVCCIVSHINTIVYVGERGTVVQSASALQLAGAVKL